MIVDLPVRVLASGSFLLQFLAALNLDDLAFMSGTPEANSVVVPCRSIRLCIPNLSMV